MAYNKKKVLEQNVQIIKTALDLHKNNKTASNEEISLLREYKGFGGLKFVLNSPSDPSQWSKSDLPFLPKIAELHSVIQQFSFSELEYIKYIDSLKSSVLTAFYTPKEITQSLFGAIKEQGISITNMLDPSAGVGVFVDSCLQNFSGVNIKGFEKDLVTGEILYAIHNRNSTDINIEGFEEIKNKDLESFDLVSSNIPFGDFKVFDPLFLQKDKKAFNHNIHNYFFAKGVDALRDGGILAFITSQGVADSPKNTELRKYLMDRCNLVSCIRLPNNLFVDNANTEVGSDLIILQKNNTKTNNLDHEQLFVNCFNKDNIFTNDYIDNNPEYIIATKSKIDTNLYGRKAWVHVHEGDINAISQELKYLLGLDLRRVNMPLYNQGIKREIKEPKEEIIINTSPREQNKIINFRKKRPVNKTQSPTLFDLFDNSLFELHTSMRKTEDVVTPIIKQEPILIDRDGLKVGSITIHNSIIGHLEKVDDENKLLFTPIQNLSSKEEKHITDYIKLRDCYNKLYNTELLSQEENKPLREELNVLYDDFIAKYEYLNSKGNLQILKFDIPSKFEILSLERFVSEKIVKSDIFFKAVGIVKQDNIIADTPIDALFSCFNIKGCVDLEYIQSSLSDDYDRERIISELEGKIYFNPLANNFETVERFISGNVVEKIKEIEHWIREHEPNDQIEKSLKALKNARPELIPFEELEFNLGERWINPKVYAAFANFLFETSGISIDYYSSIDEYTININSFSKNSYITEKYAVRSQSRTFDGIALLGYAMHNISPKITRKININGQETTVEDRKAIQLAINKIEQIRTGYSKWINSQDITFKNKITQAYNDKFNCFVKPKYDGSFQTFPNLDRKALALKFGINDIYSSQKDAIHMLKMNNGGICDHEVGGGKTLTMCIAAYEMKRLGIAKKPMILSLKANVQDIAQMFKLAYPTAKILYPSVKDFTPDNRIKIFNLIKNNDYDCIILTHDQFKAIPPSLEIQMDVLQQEIDAVDNNLNVVRFKIDKVSKQMEKGLQKRKINLTASFDETMFKIKEKQDDVVNFKTMGIDHLLVDESHEFKNLMYSTRHTRVAGLGNQQGSQRALNLLMAIRTIQERTGKDLGATFLSGTVISNSLTELFLIFKYLRPNALKKQNIDCFDAWAAIYAQKTIDFEPSVVASSEIIAKERFRYFIKVPELAMFYNEITDYRNAKMIGIDRPEKNEILHKIPPTADQKIFIEKLINFAKTGDATIIGRKPLTSEQDQSIMLIATNYARKMALDMRLIDPIYDDDVNSKASHCAANINHYYRKYHEHKGTQFVFSDLGTYKKKEWNVYSDIKEKLVTVHGIPEEEIRFIQECKTAHEKEKLIADLNSGDVRVVFGSTVMLGTGINAQARAVAVHHLDTPWRPSDLEQREGRAIRKGNTIAKLYAENKVDVIIYAVERSLDAYKFNLLHNKQLFISQLKTNQLGKRRIDEGTMSEDTGTNFAEYVASLSGNTDLLKKSKVENKITVLEGEKALFVREQREIKLKLSNLNEEKANLQKTYQRVAQDDDDFCARKQYDDENNLLNPLVIHGLKDSDQISEELNRLNMEGDTKGKYERIGEIYGFSVVYKTEESLYTRVNRFFVEGAAGIKYSFNNGYLAKSKGIALVNFINALGSITDTRERYTKKMNEITEKIILMEKIAQDNIWNNQDKLDELKKELQQINHSLSVQSVNKKIIKPQQLKV